MNFGQGVFGGAWPAVWTLLKIVAIVAPLMLGVAYLTWFERKVIGYMQVRIGPNRVGPWGLIQPIADGLKLLLKEIIVPSGANKGIFLIAPMLAIGPAGSRDLSRRIWQKIMQTTLEHIDSDLKGDEIFKFFVLYSDDDNVIEKNIEHFDINTVIDFDEFCNEVDNLFNIVAVSDFMVTNLFN